MYGMMAGFPFWPKMILSAGLYDSFNKDELEWVILHEAAHCFLWHNLQSFCIEMIILIFGIAVIKAANLRLFEIIPFSVILSVVCIQTIKWTTEYVADRYVIERVNNPQGVLLAQDKFRKNYRHDFFNNDKGLFRLLFHWNITSSQRVAMVNERKIYPISRAVS